MRSLYRKLGLKEQCYAKAGDLALDAALKKLLDEALMPLKQLEEQTDSRFIALLRQGTVELLALAPDPSANAASWHPDGSPASEPFPFDERFPSRHDTNSTAETVTQEIAIRVRTRTGSLSWPVLRFDKEARVTGMGSILHPESPNQTALLFCKASRARRRRRGQHQTRRGRGRLGKGAFYRKTLHQLQCR